MQPPIPCLDLYQKSRAINNVQGCITGGRYKGRWDSSLLMIVSCLYLTTEMTIIFVSMVHTALMALCGFHIIGFDYEANYVSIFALEPKRCKSGSQIFWWQAKLLNPLNNPQHFAFSQIMCSLVIHSCHHTWLLTHALDTFALSSCSWRQVNFSLCSQASSLPAILLILWAPPPGVRARSPLLKTPDTSLLPPSSLGNLLISGEASSLYATLVLPTLHSHSSIQPEDHHHLPLLLFCISLPHSVTFVPQGNRV